MKLWKIIPLLGLAASAYGQPFLKNYYTTNQNPTVAPGGLTTITNAATTVVSNSTPIRHVSSRGIANGLSTIFNDGMQFGPDTPGTLTCGIQEAINSLPLGPGTYGYYYPNPTLTNTGGGIVQLGPGTFFTYDTIRTPNNTNVFCLKIRGPGVTAGGIAYVGEGLPRDVIKIGVPYSKNTSIFYIEDMFVASNTNALTNIIYINASGTYDNEQTYTGITNLGGIDEVAIRNVNVCSYWMMTNNLFSTLFTLVQNPSYYKKVNLIGINIDANWNGWTTVERCWLQSVMGIALKSDHAIIRDNFFGAAGNNQYQPVNDWPVTSRQYMGAAVTMYGLNGNEAYSIINNTFISCDLCYFAGDGPVKYPRISYNDQFEGCRDLVATTGHPWVMMNPCLGPNHLVSGPYVEHYFTNNWIVTNTADFTHWRKNPDRTNCVKIVDLVRADIRFPLRVFGPLTATNINEYRVNVTGKTNVPYLWLSSADTDQWGPYFYNTLNGRYENWYSGTNYIYMDGGRWVMTNTVNARGWVLNSLFPYGTYVCTTGNCVDDPYVSEELTGDTNLFGIGRIGIGTNGPRGPLQIVTGTNVLLVANDGLHLHALGKDKSRASMHWDGNKTVLHADNMFASNNFTFGGNGVSSSNILSDAGSTINGVQFTGQSNIFAHNLNLFGTFSGMPNNVITQNNKSSVVLSNSLNIHPPYNQPSSYYAILNFVAAGAYGGLITYNGSSYIQLGVNAEIKMGADTVAWSDGVQNLGRNKTQQRWENLFLHGFTYMNSNSWRAACSNVATLTYGDVLWCVSNGVPTVIYRDGNTSRIYTNNLAGATWYGTNVLGETAVVIGRFTTNYDTSFTAAGPLVGVTNILRAGGAYTNKTGVYDLCPYRLMQDGSRHYAATQPTVTVAPGGEDPYTVDLSWPATPLANGYLLRVTTNAGSTYFWRDVGNLLATNDNRFFWTVGNWDISNPAGSPNYMELFTRFGEKLRVGGDIRFGATGDTNVLADSGSTINGTKLNVGSNIVALNINVVSNLLAGNATVGRVGLTNSTVLTSNLTARGSVYARENSYITVTGCPAGVNKEELNGNWYWHIENQCYTNRIGNDFGSATFKTTYWEIRIAHPAGGWEGFYRNTDEINPTYVISSGSYTFISGDENDTPAVTALNFPPSMYVNNGYIGVNTASPTEMIDVQGTYARTKVDDGGIQVSTDSNGRIAVLGSSGSAYMVADADTGLVAVSGDIFQADVIKDWTGNSYDQIDLYNHILTDSGGDIPFWFVNGKLYATLGATAKFSSADVGIDSHTWNLVHNIKTYTANAPTTMGYVNNLENLFIYEDPSGYWRVENLAATIVCTNQGYIGTDMTFNTLSNNAVMTLNVSGITNGPALFPDALSTMGNITAHRGLTSTNAIATNQISLPYGQYSSLLDNVVTNTGTTNVVIFTDIDAASRITPTVDPGNFGRFTIHEPGTYMIVVSAVCDTGAVTPGPDIMELWLSVNGTIGSGGGAIPNSNTRIALNSASIEHTLAVSFVYKFAAGNYFELWYTGSDTDAQFNYTAAAAGPPYRPACPSVIMSINKISD